MSDERKAPPSADGPRYPGYDVLSKRRGPSWNDATRRVIDTRLAMPREARFLDQVAWRVLEAVCARIMPQPMEREPIPLPAMVDEKLLRNAGDGYRDARLPPSREAWQRGLGALQAESQARHGCDFAALDAARQDALLHAMQAGTLQGEAWQGLPSALFFSERVLHDITSAYYAHPIAWNEIGFGGPASPRGYVRMNLNRRDPWEAVEAKAGRERQAATENRRVK